MSHATDEATRSQRVQRWRTWLSGADAEGAAGNGRRGGSSTNLLVGVWLHAAARAEQGLELTELERTILGPWQDRLGEEVREAGRVYREQRDGDGPVAVLPQAVTSRSLQEGFTVKEYQQVLAELLPQILAAPNIAVVDRAKLATGEKLTTPEYTAALGEYGYGVVGCTDRTSPQAGVSSEPFRARLEWNGFLCYRAVGDQGGGKDEIYWTAACNATDYQHTTRTKQTGDVEEGKPPYPIHGDHQTGSMAFFDTRLQGCGSAVITLWEADQSNAEWYDALGRWLQQVVDGLKLSADFSSLIPGLDLYGHAYEAMSLLAKLWENLRNKDDLVLQQAFIFGPEDLAAIYYNGSRIVSWEFDARDKGMGNFDLRVIYSGEEPPVPSGTRIYIFGGWPGLGDFGSGIDAACNEPGSPSHIWMFRGEQCLRYDAGNKRIASGPTSISSGLPGLAGTSFASKIDAACSVPGSSSDVFLFHRASYLRYNLRSHQIIEGPALVGSWPGLTFTIFGLGVEAACPVPGHNTDVLLFRYTSYVRYDTQAKKVVEGPARISERWPALENTDFVAPSAACAVPGSNIAFYLFRDQFYTRNAL
ncbi:hypothetical protein [Nocardia abscessus]|uniref:hypothetical protein n=1 Tax=Nocardia abscessus TaxID=120957 RepID=UPI00245569CF|nr:hypothetical protein [Nocardia abscessus]